MHKSRMRLLSLTLALGMSVMAGAGGLSMEAAAREYTDREQVLDTGFTLDTEYTLKLANPSEDISTTAANYYITGSSDPDSSLSCNGEEVESRGVYGSFGIYAELAMGENTFRFENGDDSQTLTITRTKAQTSEEVTTITNLRRMQPSSDGIYHPLHRSGKRRGHRNPGRKKLPAQAGGGGNHRGGSLLFR